jgi:hypothetical protein
MGGDHHTINFACLLFTILRPFETRESIRQKVDNRGQIVLWYWQHATSLAMATVFVVYMSPIGVLLWVRGKAEQKHSITFCVFGQTRRASALHTLPSPSHNIDKASQYMARLFMHLALL